LKVHIFLRWDACRSFVMLQLQRLACDTSRKAMNSIIITWIRLMFRLTTRLTRVITIFATVPLFFSKCLFVRCAVRINIQIFVRQAYKYSADKYSFLRIACKYLCGTAMTVWNALEMHGKDHGFESMLSLKFVICLFLLTVMIRVGLVIRDIFCEIAPDYRCFCKLKIEPAKMV